MTVSAIIKIVRPINLIITLFSVVIAAAISSSFSQLNADVVIIAFSVVFSFAAGNVINDVIDFEIDKINRPDRVLPKGLITITQAKMFFILFVIISLFLSYLISLKFFSILIFLNMLLFLYSTHFKGIILLSNLVVAFATSFPLVLGGLVVGYVEGGLIPAAFAFLTNFIREIIKDMEDVKGDKLKGIKTFPQIAGLNKATDFNIILLISLIFLDMLPFIFDIYGIEYFVIIMVFVNPIFFYTMFIIYKSNELSTLRKASNLIKLNMLIGLVAILIGA